jgi:hypothetical protein
LSTSTRLKGLVWIVIAGVVLTALAILALLPGTAQAQEEAEAQEHTGPTASVEAEQNSTTDDQKGASAAWRPAPEPSMTRLVVEPGDSLWAIAQERLGPEATPQQVAQETGRIYELNRDQIGENPNLIFPGQEFFLVSAAPRGAAAAPEQPVAVTEQQAPEPIVIEPEGVSDSPAAEDAAIEDVVPEGGVSEGAVSKDPVSEDAIPAAPPTRDQADEQAESAPAESVPAESAAPATTAGSIVGSVLEAYNNLKDNRGLLAAVGTLALTLIILIAIGRAPRRGPSSTTTGGTEDENYSSAEAPRQVTPETKKVHQLRRIRKRRLPSRWRGG